MTTSKFEVVIKRWSDKEQAVIKEVAGEFTEYRFAKMFAQMYSDKYKATVEIVEFRQFGIHEITPNL